MFFLLCSYRLGNIDAGDMPSIQLEVQNFIVIPLCTITHVAAEKRATSMLSIGRLAPLHTSQALSNGTIAT
jgi:hypothetical protein